MRLSISCLATHDGRSLSDDRTVAKVETARARFLCKHLIVYRGSCVRCHELMGDNSGTWFDRLSRPSRFSGLRAEDLNKRKLHLILDLDNTLLHSVRSDALLEGERTHLRDVAYCLKDYSSRRDFFLVGDYVAKLRPFVREFLREASIMFEMSIYTLGGRGYGKAIARFIDPVGLYFGDRLIGREDCTVKGRKSLDVVPATESRVIIIDDKIHVWPKNSANVISIEPYHYFSTMTRKGKEDDGRALSTILERLRRIHRSYLSTGPGFYGTKDVRILLNVYRN